VTRTPTEALKPADVADQPVIERTGVPQAGLQEPGDDGQGDLTDGQPPRPIANSVVESAVPRSGGSLIFSRHFGPWFWGNAISNTGSWVFNVTAVVVVFEISGSALLVGLVSVAQFASLAVFSPWAGALSDRFPRRRMVMAGQSFAALSATSIAVAAMVLGVDGLPGAWPVLLAALGIGMGKSFAGPSASSLIPALVDDADLEGAVSLTQLTYNVGRALGPVGAGVLLATVGPEMAFAINAGSFVVFIVALVFVHVRPQPTIVRTADRSVRAGFRHVRENRVIRYVLLGASTAGFAADPVITLAPALTDSLGGTDTLVAAMVSGFGILATLASFASAPLQRRVGSLRLAATGMGLMAAGLLVAGAAPSATVAVIGFGINGAGFALGITSFTSVLHRRVPDELRGRIMALWVVAFLGNRPIAAVLHGAAADVVGPHLAIGIAVVVALGGVRLAIRLNKDSTYANSDRLVSATT
jgi:MFS family permease